jgi:hypothetical protein
MACDITDYLYTNNIEPLIPVVQDAAEASDALSNLLDLLQLADLWDLPDIKYHVGIIIVVRLNLIAPETLDLSKTTTNPPPLCLR